jgi:predicted  nucleic acid-binding Zn-ribbon protein
VNAATLITLITTVLGVEGPLVQIDIGYTDGVRRGDIGAAYYDVASDTGVETVAVGTARVVAAKDGQSVLLADAATTPAVGHLVKFEIPESRIASLVETGGTVLEVIDTAVVSHDTNPCLRFRDLPGSFGHSITCLAPGRALEILDRAGAWTLARLDDGTEGWVATAFLVASGSGAQTVAPAGSEPMATTLGEGDIDHRLEQANAAIETSQRVRDQLDARPQNHDTANTGEVTELHQSKQAIEGLREQIQQTERELAEAQKSHEGLSQKVIEETIRDLQIRLEEAEATTREAEISRRALMTELESMKEENATLRRRLATAETLRDEAVAESARLSERLAATEPVSPAERETMAAEIDRLQQALADEQARVRELEGDLRASEAGEDNESNTERRGSRWKFWKRDRTPSGDSESRDDSGNEP